MYARKVYTAAETADDTHDEAGDIFFRNDSSKHVHWRIARFSNESDKEAVRQIWNCGYLRITTTDGKEYHRINMASIPSAMSCCIARHMGMDKRTVESIIRNLV